MLDFIPGWDSLKENRWLKNDQPNQYVLYSVSGEILGVFDDECLTATATIGQRDPNGRLFQNSLHSRHFAPRKFTIAAQDATAQIQSLHQLIEALNGRWIDPDDIPRKVSSTKAWASIVALLEVSK